MDRNKDKLIAMRTRLNELYDAYERVDKDIKSKYINTGNVVAPYEEREILLNEINTLREEIAILEKS